MKIYLGLVHHPIRNKKGELVTTSVTNLDIHDISRSARTFGLEKYFIITPLERQKELVGRILGHWQQNQSLAYNPDRQDALQIVELADSFEWSIEFIEKQTGKRPLVVVTGANFSESDGDEEQLLSTASLDGRDIYLLFGTGWGLHADILQQADFSLNPIYGAATDGYNHLSVRSAVAIYLDRLARAIKG